mmetsp:Transcript_13861/g.20888  ORF Transcript_13861/g.20888 Transcript_13861/m.20888 type:complete len:211 (-) Transcript_13861:329-961(-)
MIFMKSILTLPRVFVNSLIIKVMISRIFTTALLKLPKRCLASVFHTISSLVVTKSCSPLPIVVNMFHSMLILCLTNLCKNNLKHSHVVFTRCVVVTRFLFSSQKNWNFLFVVILPLIFIKLRKMPSIKDTLHNHKPFVISGRSHIHGLSRCVKNCFFLSLVQIVSLSRVWESSNSNLPVLINLNVCLSHTLALIKYYYQIIKTNFFLKIV